MHRQSLSVTSTLLHPNEAASRSADTAPEHTPFCSTPPAGEGRAAARPPKLPLVGKTVSLFKLSEGLPDALQSSTEAPPRPKAQARRGPGRLHFVPSRGGRAANMEAGAGRAAGAAVAPWAGPGPQGPRARPALRGPLCSAPAASTAPPPAPGTPKPRSSLTAPLAKRGTEDGS